jgi:hypothetical protein
MGATRLEDLDGTTWTGTSRLWFDPTADPVSTSDATASIEGDVLRYTWSYEGQAHEGSYTIRRTGGDAVETTFTDTWHQKTPLVCAGTAGSGPLLSVRGAYPAPEGPPWGWRTVVSVRDSGELVLQMINVPPWGEEQLAVLLVAQRR